MGQNISLVWWQVTKLRSPQRYDGTWWNGLNRMRSLTAKIILSKANNRQDEVFACWIELAL